MRAMHARGGVVCRLLSSGTIRADVEVLPVDDFSFFRFYRLVP